MATNTANKITPHPSGVWLVRGHTELLEEPHEKAHIDYDFVAIIPNPSVAVLYEDGLVYETGSTITSADALIVYSGAKTGRLPLGERIVREPSSENEIWWGPVNKTMTTDVRTYLSTPTQISDLSLPSCFPTSTGEDVRAFIWQPRSRPTGVLGLLEDLHLHTSSLDPCMLALILTVRI
ncbi:hypothetical protein B0O99DRAFT_599540 [Bisporella sp. PMI_857]|nr:hypothetical protein B0O99DRAFT_599540 [Bisporella sp. PMI_857]